jgi:glutamyl-Q tRNA(Asp) synthetase
MMSSRTVGRFAPSPTGPLHFGSLVAALASYLDARHAGGRWLVRIEDLDAPRCDPAHAQSILATLRAFGFVWDGEVVWQSRRGARYTEGLALLSERAQVYACACSRREIADSAVHGIDGPVYPGTCRPRDLPRAAHALRVAVPDAEIRFVDATLGAQCQNLARAIGDFVVRRKDGLFTYQLAVVLDDADQGVTDVVRGADLIDSTARQIFLQTALGLPQPRYRHIPAATNAEGQKWSKQTLAPALAADHACAELNRALAFLGQRQWRESSPRALLERAAQSWDADAIPKARAQAVTLDTATRGP